MSRPRNLTRTFPPFFRRGYPRLLDAMYVCMCHGKRPHKTAYRRRIITLSLLAPAFAMIECRGYSYVSPFLSITVKNLACVCLM